MIVQLELFDNKLIHLSHKPVIHSSSCESGVHVLITLIRNRNGREPAIGRWVKGWRAMNTHPEPPECPLHITHRPGSVLCDSYAADVPPAEAETTLRSINAMDPLSITASCVTLVTTITKLSVLINGFVREVRDARRDLDAVSRELLSLQPLLEILSDDAGDSAFPASLLQQIAGIIKNSGVVLEDIEKLLQTFSAFGLRRSMKWAINGRDDMAKLRSTLEAHKSALDIALDMAAL